MDEKQMRALAAAAFLSMAATAAVAEVKNEQFVVGDYQIWIEVFDSLELMFVGKNDYERDQVLSGADVEIAAFANDADSAALLGGPAVVATVTGTQSCEDGDPRAYYVISFDGAPALDGPLTTCKELTVSVTPGAVVLESDPMAEDGEFWAWAPGKGFGPQQPD